MTHPVHFRVAQTMCKSFCVLGRAHKIIRSFNSTRTTINLTESRDHGYGIRQRVGDREAQRGMKATHT